MENFKNTQIGLELMTKRITWLAVVATLVVCTIVVGAVKSVDGGRSNEIGASSLSALAGSVEAQIVDPGIPDTVYALDTSVAPGQKFPVQIVLFNDEGVSGASLGLTWSSPDLILDSVSYTGTRVDALPNEATFGTIDNLNRTVIIGFVEFSSPVQPLTPGTGVMAKLWYTVQPGAAVQQIIIDSAFVPPEGEFLLSTTIGEVFAPQFRSGVVNVLIDTDGDAVADEFDNCPSKFNPLQEDFDGDGLGDSCFLPAYLFPLTFVAHAESESPGISPPSGWFFPPADAQVNLTVTDPEGLIIGADSLGNITNTIGADATYDEINGEDSIVIHSPKTGEYTVEAVAKAGGTTPGALYSVDMRTDGTVQSQVGGLTSVPVPASGETATATATTEPYKFGDANNDRAFNIADVTFLIQWIFNAGIDPVNLAAVDSNCDGGTNIADVTYDIAHIFSAGPAPGCD